MLIHLAIGAPGGGSSRQVMEMDHLKLYLQVLTVMVDKFCSN